MNTRQSRRQSSCGFTLIDSLVVVATLAVTLGTALPGLQAARQARQLEGAAAQLSTDVMHARSLAVAMVTPVRLSVQQQRGGACYVVHTGHAGDCSCDDQGRATCTGGAQSLHAVGFNASQSVQLRSNSPSMLFDPDRGTVTPTGTLSLSLPDGRGLNAVVNIMGRVRRCATGAAMTGYPEC